MRAPRLDAGHVLEADDADGSGGRADLAVAGLTAGLAVDFTLAELEVGVRFVRTAAIARALPDTDAVLSLVEVVVAPPPAVLPPPVVAAAGGIGRRLSSSASEPGSGALRGGVMPVPVPLPGETRHRARHRGRRLAGATP